MTEIEFIKHLKQHYGGNLSEFFATIHPAHCPMGEIPQDKSATTVFDAFVQTCKGMKVVLRQEVFAALSDSVPSSWVFEELKKNRSKSFEKALGEIAAERQSGRTKKAKKKMVRNKANEGQDTNDQKRDTKKGKPIEFKPNLNRKKARRIVETVLTGADSSELCDESAARHAVGAAIGCLAVNTARESFQIVIDMLDVGKSDIRMEEDPIEKADSHVRVLESLCKLFEQIVEPRYEDGDGEKNKNYLNLVFLHLPGSGPLVNNRITPVIKTMHDIAEDLSEGLRKILFKQVGKKRKKAKRKKAKTKKAKTKKARAKQLLEKKAHALGELHDDFKKIVDDVDVILGQIVRDWENDVKSLKNSCVNSKRDCA